MTELPPLNILCFGDSLTEGYSQYGLKMTPYSQWMWEGLQEKAESEGGLGTLGWEKVKVRTRGESGERVIDGFKRRMVGEYSAENSAEDPYDWVIFLGGTNDIGWGKKIDDIWNAIVEITSIPLKNGAKLLMMTVPECRVKSDSLDAKRNDLNSRIKNDSREGVFVFDLFEKMPYHSMAEDQRDELWDDGLHFTEKGYELIGGMVAERLIELLSGKDGKENKTSEGKA